MGCDIHFHTEVKIDGEWHHMGAPNIPRNYELFNKLAGVRAGVDSEDPIAEPRGLPADATFLTRYDAEVVWKGDGHSHSWIDSSEISDLEKWLNEKWKENPSFLLWTEQPEYHKYPEKLWGFFFGNSWGGVLLYSEDSPKGVEDVRFCFWFDN